MDAMMRPLSRLLCCSSTGRNACQAVPFRCAAEGEQLSSQEQAVAPDMHFARDRTVTRCEA